MADESAEEQGQEAVRLGHVFDMRIVGPRLERREEFRRFMFRRCYAGQEQYFQHPLMGSPADLLSISRWPEIAGAIKENLGEDAEVAERFIRQCLEYERDHNA